METHLVNSFDKETVVVIDEIELAPGDEIEMVIKSDKVCNITVHTGSGLLTPSI